MKVNMKLISEEDILKSLIKQASQLEIESEERLHQLKKKFAREYSIPLATNIRLQTIYEQLLNEGWQGSRELQRLLRKRKIRTLSGVSVITVLTKPYPCPGKCVFCPTEPGMPKSYLSNEPGAMRAVLDDFHPRDQVRTRIQSLKAQGHETDKIEMIVLGGTFSAYQRRYQSHFVRALFNACNPQPGRSLAQAQILNESSANRIIGLSLETRPDHVTEDEIAHMRRLGCTKVQIGLQHTDNAILDLNKRGEKVEDSYRAIQLLKDAGFKIATHLMPNLAGSTPEKDLKMFNEVFNDSRLRPDHIKIYPCVVTPYSELEQWWKEGNFEAYSDEILMKLLIEMKKIVPDYVRIERLFRDIPGESILGGSQKTNMRQLLEKMMNDTNAKCRCIRCREIKDEVVNLEDLDFQNLPYEASEGQEFFMSYRKIDGDRLAALLRLRFHSYSLKGKKHFLKELEGAAIIREVHTYGTQVKIGMENEGASQHLGLGKKLVEKAEEIAKSNGFNKMAVISGVGTRNYYRKWGYELEGTYMTKVLT